MTKDLGSEKIKRTRKQYDDIGIISSGRFCISTSSNVARTLKLKIPKQNPKHDELFQNRPDLTQILHFSQAEPIAAPPTQPSVAGPSAPQIIPILRKEKRTIQVSYPSDSDTSSVKRSKRHIKKQKAASDSQTQSIVQNIQNTEGYSTEIPIFGYNFQWPCFP